jgi:hypothetical protein
MSATYKQGLALIPVSVAIIDSVYERTLKGKGCIENSLQHYFDFSFGRVRVPNGVHSGEPEVRVNLEGTLF